VEHSAAQSSAHRTTCYSNDPCILHEHEEWIVVQKPAGWHSVEARSSSGGEVLARWLAGNHPTQAQLPDAGLVHRLDQCTSGCMIAAKNAAMHSVLRGAVSGRGEPPIGKMYLALVRQGIAVQGRFELLFSSRHKGSAKVTVCREGVGERGMCSWRVVRAAVAATSADDESGANASAFDLIEVELHGPGRRHQIRAGMAFMGHPLAGDLLYRGRPMCPPVCGGCFALHAFRISIGKVTVESPRPPWAHG